MLGDPNGGTDGLLRPEQTRILFVEGSGLIVKLMLRVPLPHLVGVEELVWQVMSIGRRDRREQRCGAGGGYDQTAGFIKKPFAGKILQLCPELPRALGKWHILGTFGIGRTDDTTATVTGPSGMAGLELLYAEDFHLPASQLHERIATHGTQADYHHIHIWRAHHREPRLIGD
ncbi:hypothetical protein Rhe02_46540 [Rhizocola hellebori]|uniref:Uncharacterized protein n=1 Tax=Rhizocola hellebori TaxID=1392758 RepID=A0A8J3QB37_9ACTN|nr:hypothetical protein Rhe02_46540 [Rhizocola hellebori]